jgi:hypothetical protein
MKKLFFTVGIVCLLAACEIKYYSVLIINESSKTVSYTYNDISDTLLPHDPSQDPPQDPSEYSRTHEVKAYTKPPANIKVTDGALSVIMNQKGDAFTFVDVEPIAFSVKSLLPFDIKIKADNYIWDDKEKLLELSIPAQKEVPNKERPEGLFIYTEKPKFTTTTSYPVIYVWNIIDLDELDDSGNPKKKLSLIVR